MKKNIAVLLSGSGVFDGAELHESVLSLFFIKKCGHNYTCFAPNRDQHHVVNHLTSEISENESRNILVESARIARGEILDVSQYDPNDYDGLMIPGGFGVAKNFFSFAFDGAEASLESDIKKMILGTHKLKKPIGACCISPVLLARVFQETGVQIQVTVGTAIDEAEGVESFGAINHIKEANEYHVDSENIIVTTPAYTCANDIAEVGDGIEKVINYLCNY